MTNNPDKIDQDKVYIANMFGQRLSEVHFEPQVPLVDELLADGVNLHQVNARVVVQSSGRVYLPQDVRDGLRYIDWCVNLRARFRKLLKKTLFKGQPW